MTNEIQNKIRNVRADASGKCRPTTDPTEITEAEPEDDLAFVLIQMKSQALKGVEEAMQRLDEGNYGYCVDCGEAIAPSRLRALLFAVRCKPCEETNERLRRRRTH